MTKPLLLWKSSKYYIFVCACTSLARARACVCVWGGGGCLRAGSLSNPACSVLPIAICGLYGCNTLFDSNVSHKWHDLRKMLLNIKCVFGFSVQLLFETFLILLIIQ